MKNFLSMVVLWIVAMLIFTFLFGWFFIDVQHFYRLPILIAVIFAAISVLFMKQSEKIEELEERITSLERRK